MKLVKKEYVKILEICFKIAYLFLGLVTFNVFLYDSAVQPILVRICIVLGIATILGRLLFFKSYWKTPYWILLGIFCISFLISMLANIRYGAFFSDFKWLIWTGLVFLILYICDTTRTFQEYKKEFQICAHIMIIYSVIAAAVSLYLMIQSYQAMWYTENGELLIAGFQWGRLWGVYTDPNYGGVFTTVSVLLCCYFVKCNKNYKKVPYILFIIIDYLYIVFCDSRTAELAMVLAVSFWLIYTAIQKKEKKTILFRYVLTALVFTGIFIGGTSTLKLQYNNQIQQKFQKEAENSPSVNENIGDISMEEDNTQEYDTPIENQKVGREEDIEKDVSNGRIALWSSGIDVWKTKAILGTGYNSFLPYVKENLPNTYVVNNPQGDYVSLHNEYLNILVYQGIFGASVFLIFIVMVIRRWVKTFRSISADDRDYIGILSACCLVVAVAMLFLLEGLHTNSPGVFVLWSFLGYLMHYSIQNQKNKG